MATMVLLVRHTHHHLIGRALVGRMPDVPLNSAGFRQAWRLAERLAGERITCVQSSPQLRARQTARPIANALELPVEVRADIDEVDFGDWAGCTFDELDHDPAWLRWNAERGSACTPGGETMRDVQRRMLKHLARLRTTHSGGRVILVTHAEPIRAAVLHYRGMSLDEFAAIRVDPASVTRILVHELGGELISENDRPETLEAA